MKSNKLSILFLFQKSKINKKGKGPLRCRITYRKKRKVFSTGIFIRPEEWNNTEQEVNLNPSAEYFNNELNLIKSKLYQAFLFLRVNESEFTLDDIYKKYKGENTSNEMGVMEVYNLHSDRIKKLIGKDIKLVTYNKYLESGKHLQGYIRWKFSSKDTQLSTLKFGFIKDYEYYLKTEKNLAQSTLNKAIQRFRRVINYAVSEEYIMKDPFMLYKPKSLKKEVIFLTKQELSKLESKDFEIDRLQRIKDMFVFCCYTGLGFKEMDSLKKEDVYVEFDNNLWIHIYRNKTGRTYKIPILPKAKEILDKYKDYESEYVLPKTHNPLFNAYLKEIADIVGIKKNLTHHIARKTFATTILLYNDVPMEIVSKLLGHSKLQTTQDHYGQILEKKIGAEMTRLNDILE